jgi:arylsulfatase A-like enzyme
MAASAAFGMTPWLVRGNSSGGRRPNLVFVFTDQQAWDTLGCYGNDQVHTPNLDQFASQSVCFDSCFSTFPVCTPMRAMLMSGQHPLRNGCCRNDWQMLPNNGPTFASVLGDHGYRTAYIGKWHLYGGNRNRPVPAGPHRQGFDEVFLSNNCAVRFQPEEAFFWDGQNKKKFGEWEQFGQTDQAVEYLKGCSTEDPFAMFVSWHPPHAHVCDPKYEGYQAPQNYLDRYDLSKIRLRPDQPDDARHRTMTRGYFSLVDTIDDCFGQIEKTLQDRGLADNTLVVFTSDHGDLLRYVDGKLQTKTRPEPASCQVPLLMRYPGELAPRRSELVVGTLDLMPTILGLMNLPVPETCEGENLAHAIRGGDDSASTETPIFSLLGEPGWRGIVTTQYIYAKGFKNDAYHRSYNLLIDRKKDPYALNNFYGKEEANALQEKLHEKTVDWMETFGDRGWGYADLQRVSAVQEKGFMKVSGELNGRPIDLIKEDGATGVLDR